jgi:DNA polymerase III alpha subunit
MTKYIDETIPSKISNKLAASIEGNEGNEDDTADKKNRIPIDYLVKINGTARELYNTSEQYKEWLDNCDDLIGVPMANGQHACGIVVLNDPVDETLPLMKPNAKATELVSQYVLDDIDKSSIPKFDFLVIDGLDSIRSTIRWIGDISIEDIIPWEPFKPLQLDTPTQELLERGDAAGVFQLTGVMGKDIVRSIKPKSVLDLAAATAMNRPALLAVKAHEQYMRRKEGSEPTTYPHPKFESLLKETYGIIVYQEQALSIAKQLAGYTWGETDKLRKVLGKKKVSEIENHRNKFTTGLKETCPEMTEEECSSVFDLVAEFAGYGFNKAHAVGYAMIMMITAWLKAHYRVEFLAANLSINGNSTSDRCKNVYRQLMKSVRINKVRFIPPDINNSAWEFVPVSELWTIKSGLCKIPDLSEATYNSMIKYRPYDYSKADMQIVRDATTTIDQLFYSINNNIISTTIMPYALSEVYKGLKNKIDNKPIEWNKGNKTDKIIEVLPYDKFMQMYNPISCLMDRMSRKELTLTAMKSMITTGCLEGISDDRNKMIYHLYIYTELKNKNPMYSEPVGYVRHFNYAAKYLPTSTFPLQEDIDLTVKENEKIMKQHTYMTKEEYEKYEMDILGVPRTIVGIDKEYVDFMEAKEWSVVTIAGKICRIDIDKKAKSGLIYNTIDLMTPDCDIYCHDYSHILNNKYKPGQLVEITGKKRPGKEFKGMASDTLIIQSIKIL